MRLPIATFAVAAVLLLSVQAHGEPRHGAQLSIEMAESADVSASVLTRVPAPSDDVQLAGLHASADTTSADATSADTSSSRIRTALSAPSRFSALLSGVADQLLGIRYQFGGNTESGVDCSGLIRLVWERLGLGLSTLPRTAANMATLGLPVSLSDIKPGDLVFFNTLGHNFSHVGVYLGEGRFLHASSGQRRVTLSSLSERYFRDRFEGARRLLTH